MVLVTILNRKAEGTVWLWVLAVPGLPACPQPLVRPRRCAVLSQSQTRLEPSSRMASWSSCTCCNPCKIQREHTWVRHLLYCHIPCTHGLLTYTPLLDFLQGYAFIFKTLGFLNAHGCKNTFEMEIECSCCSGICLKARSS